MRPTRALSRPIARWIGSARRIPLVVQPGGDACTASTSLESRKEMKKTLAAIAFAIATLAGPSAMAEGIPADLTDMQALRAAVKADKKALVAATLALTDAEAKKFWPLYDDYQRGVDMANRQRSLAVKDLVGFDRPLSDEFARSLAKELLGADDTELRARKTLQPKLMRAMHPKKAARYLQLEAKIRAVQAYDIAATIPLVK
jgi:hypothetical protein